MEKTEKRHYAKSLRHCIICGKPFYGGGSANLCSDECRHIRTLEREAVRREKRIDVNKRYCKHCGKELTGKQRKYCSRECQFKHKYQERELKQPKDRCKCTRANSCKYARKITGMADVGIKKYCAYLEITGHIRGGYPDECTHYMRNSRASR